ncbi:hypothetical protein [Caudoviricetes sp.]|nr:hypothetical protein [Caudoviricetes sp.]
MAAGTQYLGQQYLGQYYPSSPIQSSAHELLDTALVQRRKSASYYRLSDLFFVPVISTPAPPAQIDYDTLIVRTRRAQQTFLSYFDRPDISQPVGDALLTPSDAPIRKRPVFLYGDTTQVLPDIATPTLGAFVDYQNDVMRKVRIRNYEQTPLIEWCGIDSSFNRIVTSTSFGRPSFISRGQSFTSSYTTNLCKIQVNMSTNVSYPLSDGVIMKVYKADSQDVDEIPGAPGTLIATSDNIISGGLIDFTTDNVDVTFSFDNSPVPLVGGDTYIWALERTGALSDIEYYVVYGDLDSGAELNPRFFLDVFGWSRSTIRKSYYIQFYDTQGAFIPLAKIPEPVLPEFIFRRKKPWYAYPSVQQLVNICFIDQIADDALSYSSKSFGRSTAQEYRRGQQFKPSVSAPLCKIIVKLLKTGSPSDSIMMRIYEANGTDALGTPGAPGTLLATSNNSVQSSEIATFPDEREFAFDFGGGISLLAENTYVMVLERSGAISDTDYYGVACASSGNSLYSRGYPIRYNGTSWIVQIDEDNEDFHFKQFYTLDGFTPLPKLPEPFMSEYTFRRKNLFYTYPVRSAFTDTLIPDVQTLQKLYPEYPARPIRHKDRRNIYPFVADFERSVPAPDLRAYSIHTDFVRRHKDPRHRIPSYFRYEDLIITYISCLPFSTWTDLDNQTSSWNDQPTTPETTAWTDLDNQDTGWIDTCYTDE